MPKKITMECIATYDFDVAFENHALQKQLQTTMFKRYLRRTGAYERVIKYINECKMISPDYVDDCVSSVITDEFISFDTRMCHIDFELTFEPAKDYTEDQLKWLQSMMFKDFESADIIAFDELRELIRVETEFTFQAVKVLSVTK